MFQKLRSLLNRNTTASSAAIVDLQRLKPDNPLFIVGDVHGCFDALRRVIEKVEAFVEANPDVAAQDPKLVFVGDYVDRGEKSADVLEWLHELHTSMPDRAITVMGNHERMMLDFLDDPAGRGWRWLRNGGLQTLASFSVGGVTERSDAEALTAASEALEAAMPEGMLAWLREMPTQFQSGNICVVHAAMDPHLAPEDQSRQVLLWGHNEFMAFPREDDLWVVHGHTIVKEPQIAPSRISIDTGAYATGRLTAAAILEGRCEFL